MGGVLHISRRRRWPRTSGAQVIGASANMMSTPETTALISGVGCAGLSRLAPCNIECRPFDPDGQTFHKTAKNVPWIDLSGSRMAPASGWRRLDDRTR